MPLVQISSCHSYFGVAGYFNYDASIVLPINKAMEKLMQYALHLNLQLTPGTIGTLKSLAGWIPKIYAQDWTILIFCPH